MEGRGGGREGGGGRRGGNGRTNRLGAHYTGVLLLYLW